ncbi:hypothetical protein A2115_02255 [Candidatus Woesebacteria bacterium GWA1_41_8]|jgi:ribonuclease J|uniref:Ribonuclease J n=1 Tax=Candidatus Woesebacteria bacterium GWA1_41_8 TaxID=1802471 RepID=A0A1F7WM25_9BACT|nr:MAG: hypothetical protein A2115_02255 [Candidatus Woesebacteria bacterium GWA1_41_8]
MALKFIALSGTTEVTENLYVYEYGNDMIVVDCGVAFPEAGMYGVDLVIPDFTYIRENKHKLRGIVISHGHEDHLGAVPFLLKEIKAPVYSTRLVAGFIEDKLEDYGMKGIRVNVFSPENDVLAFGNFKLTPFRISHSVPDAVGFAIDTPEGRIFHVPDYKFDWMPVDGRPFDIGKAARLASEGVLAVASDCLGATTPGYTESEHKIEERIENVVRDAKKTVFFTTISSNISRIQQALNVAHRTGRKVAFVGRSIDRKSEIARKLGYLKYPQGIVMSRKKIGKLPREKIMYIISGSYGQPGSSLYRISLGEHDFINVAESDVVIFSGDPAPPGTKVNVDYLVDRLIERNAEVHYYDMQEDLHVSGHGSQEDIKTLFALLKPKFFIPIGGTVRHMHAYKELAVLMGAKEANVFSLMPGEIVEFKNSNARKAGKVQSKSVLVDGLGIGDVGRVVLRDRKVLAEEGIAIALIRLGKDDKKLVGKPEIISRGFVFQEKKSNLLEHAGSELVRSLTKYQNLDTQSVCDLSIDFLEKYFFHETGRRPMILPVVVEI